MGKDWEDVLNHCRNIGIIKKAEASKATHVARVILDFHAGFIQITTVSSSLPKKRKAEEIQNGDHRGAKRRIAPITVVSSIAATPYRQKSTRTMGLTAITSHMLGKVEATRSESGTPTSDLFGFPGSGQQTGGMASVAGNDSAQGNSRYGPNGLTDVSSSKFTGSLGVSATDTFRPIANRSTGLNLEDTFNRNTTLSNVRPYESSVFHCVQQGDVEGFRKLLRTGQASVHDVDPYGLGLLYVRTLIRTLDIDD